MLNGASGNTLVTSLDLKQKEQKNKDLELKVEEQETLLEVKRRRHKEEIKNLRQRLDDEIQKHSEDVRSHRTKVRQLERRKSAHSISFGVVDDDYKRMYDEQRSENIKLKFTVEKQKKELEEIRSAKAKEEEKATAASAAAAAEVTERRRPHGMRVSFLLFSWHRSPAVLYRNILVCPQKFTFLAKITLFSCVRASDIGEHFRSFKPLLEIRLLVISTNSIQNRRLKPVDRLKFRK